MSRGDKIQILILVIAAYVCAFDLGHYWGKHAADLWWQADEAKKIQTVWGIAGQSIWDNAAPTHSLDPGENLWQDGRETPALSGGKYSRLPYPVCMEDTGIGYGLVPIPCPKEQR